MALMRTIFDSFNDNYTDNTEWNVYTAAGGAVAETGGMLTVTPAANVFNFNGYTSILAYDLTGSQASVEIPQGISTATGCQQFMDLSVDGNNKVSISFENTSLMCRITTNGTNSDSFVTRNDTSMRWWRLRESGGTIYWETAPDGITWTVQRSSSVSFAVISLTAGLGAGTWQGVSTPGVAKFDNFNLLYPKVSTVLEDFNDNSMNAVMWSYQNGSAQTQETNGQLIITPPANNGANYYGYLSNSTFDLTESSATIELVQGLSGTSGCEQILNLEKDSANGIAMLITGTTFTLRLRTSSTNNETAVGRVDANNKYWRIRETGGTVYWETSPNGVTWTIRRSAVPTFALTSLQIRVTAGTWKDVASPGVAIFDNLNLLGTSPTAWLGM